MTFLLGYNLKVFIWWWEGGEELTFSGEGINIWWGRRREEFFQVGGMNEFLDGGAGGPLPSRPLVGKTLAW